MRVLLVQPDGVQRGFTRSGTRLPPLGLLSVAAHLRSGAEVRFVDADALGISDEEVIRSLGGWRPELVGMTLSWLTTGPIQRFAAAARRHFGASIVVGGPLPTAAPSAVLDMPEFDLVAIGDGEVIAKGIGSTNIAFR